jgi:hypothetical protein
MSRIFQNWTFHNLVAHPVSEIVYWLARPFGVARAEALSGWIHDSTVPPHSEGEGRG